MKFFAVTILILQISTQFLCGQPKIYSSSEKYLKDDLVIYQVNTYIALKDVPEGIIPQYPKSEFWSDITIFFEDSAKTNSTNHNDNLNKAVNPKIYEVKYGYDIQGYQVNLDQAQYMALAPGEINTSTHFVNFTTHGFASSQKFNGELKALDGDL